MLRSSARSETSTEFELRNITGAGGNRRCDRSLLRLWPFAPHDTDHSGSFALAKPFPASTRLGTRSEQWPSPATRFAFPRRERRLGAHRLETASGDQTSAQVSARDQRSARSASIPPWLPTNHYHSSSSPKQSQRCLITHDGAHLVALERVVTRPDPIIDNADCQCANRQRPALEAQHHRPHW